MVADSLIKTSSKGHMEVVPKLMRLGGCYKIVGCEETTGSAGNHNGGAIPF